MTPESELLSLLKLHPHYGGVDKGEVVRNFLKSGSTKIKDLLDDLYSLWEREELEITQKWFDKLTSKNTPPTIELPRTTPEQHEKIKKLGFPINTTSKNPTPTISFVLKWLRDIKGYRYSIDWSYSRDGNFEQEWFSFTILSRNGAGYEHDVKYKTYEEAESALIDCIVDDLLKLIK
jgi:hypothetical protein